MDKAKLKEVKRNFQLCRDLFEALGDNVRLRIIMDLMDTGFKGLNVVEITARLCISRPAVSHHLKILKNAGIISKHEIGTSNYYYLDFWKRLNQVDDFISFIQEWSNSKEFQDDKENELARLKELEKKDSKNKCLNRPLRKLIETQKEFFTARENAEIDSKD